MAKKNKTDRKTPVSSNPLDRPSALEEQLGETALGAWILDHKSTAISIVALIFASVLGYGGWTIHQSKQAEQAALAVYSFEKEVLEPFVDEQGMSVDDIITKWEELEREHSGQKALLPVLLFISDELIARENFQQALELLTKGKKTFRGEFAQFFIGMRLSVVQEDLEQYSAAIETLEGLQQSPLDLIDAKIYLDLGRLYMRQGDYQKARMSFEYITQQMAQDEFVKLARVYLAELDAQNDNRSELETSSETSHVTP